MNTLRKITLIQFRNYNHSVFQFHTPVTCITGPNGSGKTNLLDAVYYLCYTKSYFSNNQQLSARSGTDGFRIEGVFEQGRKELISCKWQAGKKEVAADGVPYERLTDHIGKYAAVMIAPDDLELINDGSELRRRWVDSILGQTNREYLERLMHYQRVLQQRNAWLKMQAVQPSADSVALDYYDQQLAQHGTFLYERRKAFIGHFLPLMEPFYRQLSGDREQIAIQYETDLDQKSLAQWLREGLQHDMRLQRTTRGIHKDDWNFGFNGQPLRLFGSQGQKKSFLFALKLAQYAYLHRELGVLPILLLDDVFEKLDQARIEALLQIIRSPGFGQVLLSDTHKERVLTAFGPEAAIECIEL